jgi:type IV pilus assembly protein PilB
MAKQRLGEYLLQRGIITSEELKSVLRAQQKTKEPLGQLLVRQGVLNGRQLNTLLAEFIGMEYLSLADFIPDPETITLLSHNVARKQNIVPVTLDGNTFVVAASGPLPSLVADNLRRITGRQVRAVFMPPEELAQAMTCLYEGTETAAQAHTELPAALTDSIPDVMQIVEQILHKAAGYGASDIHIEPYQEHLRIRFRIDGILKTVDLLPPGVANMVISRLKVMSGMNIAEKRAAQDGGLKFQYEGDGETLNMSVRVSTVPSIFGEKAVLRMQASRKEPTLENLGFEPDHLEVLYKVLALPYGIFLTTGPSGSGKTTTLYAALNRLCSDEFNIITVEDPVERVIKGITQMQVDQKNSFQSALRSILRQDPDIVMVGEIRDGETARLALQAALTGHIVLSTLHTNDATSAVIRLVDMGCEAFLINATIIAVLAQRLVRLLCPACKRPYKPGSEELQALGLEPDSQETFYAAAGCPACNGLKYKGRIGVYELLVIDAGIKKLVAQEANPETLREYAIKNGMRTLRDDGIIKIRKGLTSVSEVLSATTER